MVKIILSLNELNFYQLTKVYEESLQRDGEAFYSHLSKEQRRIHAEQDFYFFMKSFLWDRNSVCAVWMVDECYISALRLEPYRDGVLLTGLETIPESRGKGFAKKLMIAASDYLRTQGITHVYSHVGKNNAISLSAHKAVGFELLLDFAAYIDGSVSQQACTLVLRIH